VFFCGGEIWHPGNKIKCSAQGPKDFLGKNPPMSGHFDKTSLSLPYLDKIVFWRLLKQSRIPKEICTFLSDG
jgi:hypothetical protein